MLTGLQKHFVPALYVVFGLLVAVNTLTLVLGGLRALLPIAIECTVLGAVYFRKPWAYIAVMLWTVIPLFTGAAMWLAVLLDGPKYFHSAIYGVFNTLMFFAGIYFFKYAKPALQQLPERI
ncbi:hypothetical protein [Rhodanobacter sp. BL-MT-08]